MCAVHTVHVKLAFSELSLSLSRPIKGGRLRGQFEQRRFVEDKAAHLYGDDFGPVLLCTVLCAIMKLSSDYSPSLKANNPHQPREVSVSSPAQLLPGPPKSENELTERTLGRARFGVQKVSKPALCMFKQRFVRAASGRQRREKHPRSTLWLSNAPGREAAQRERICFHLRFSKSKAQGNRAAYGRSGGV